MSNPQQTLLFLVTEDWYFVSHRLALARAAVAAGYRVVVATRIQHGHEKIVAAGCEVRALRWRRSGNTPWAHLRALMDVVATYRHVHPDIVHHVALKPVIVGSLAARISGIHRRVNAVAGLGYVFSSTTFRAQLARPVLKILLRWALRGDQRWTIVQNRGDQQTLLENGIVSADRVRLIRGAGVDALDYPPAAVEEAIPQVVLVARMLWDKGVGDFVAAAEKLVAAGVVARFVLVGDPDPGNPAAVPVSQLEKWHEHGPVEWWGHRDDVPEILSRSAIFCLPTRYGEGVPRSLLEGGAAGLALVASDSAGCREVIRDGVNGVLVAPGDLPALVSALGRLINDSQERVRLGRAARATIERDFSLERVIGETLDVYRAFDHEEARKAGQQG
jgi:glycosyltransferase involved in cell wall biosynthesis